MQQHITNLILEMIGEDVSSDMKKFTDQELREYVQKIKIGQDIGQDTPSQTHIIIKNPDGSSEKYYTTPSLSGRKATLILDGTEHTVTFE